MPSNHQTVTRIENESLDKLKQMSYELNISMTKLLTHAVNLLWSEHQRRVSTGAVKPKTQTGE